MRVAWVHPTWRDLVISQLAADDTARRHFLRSCGVYGIELALSTEERSAGKVRLPLIGCDGDWDAVTDRLFELADELEPTELLALLACLRQTILELEGNHDAAEMHALARTVLTRVAGLWDAAPAPIPLIQLTAWLEVAALVDSRPSMPRLSLTWVELLPTCVPDPEDRPAVERLADWLTLCELLFSYDPELKGRLGYGEEHAELMAAFLGQAELHKSLNRAAADQVVRALDAIAALEPKLHALILFVARDLRSAAAPTKSVVDDPSEPPAPELFEVRRVLADL